jgi:WS/DGAT/MGAT family acyltransferase
MLATKALTPLDSWFLHLEAIGTPMHMASIGIFERQPLEDEHGELRLDDLRQLISSRLHLVPKLRQRAHPGLLHEAPPTWNDDPSFDITEHVRHERLPAPGTEAQLLNLCSELLAEPLDYSRPLWELTFVTGLQDGTIAVIEKLHHAIADGIAAAELAMILLDSSPVVSPLNESKPWTPRPPDSAIGLASRDLRRLAEIPLRVPVWLGRGVVHPVLRTRAVLRAVRSSTVLWPARLFAPATSLNRPNGPRREVRLIRMNLHEVRDAAHRHGATINDVVLAIVSGGLHALLSARGELANASQLQALVPVGLGVGAERGIGNEVSALFVKLPVHDDDPVTALAAIASATAAQKGSHMELAPALALRLLDPAPQTVLSLSARLVRQQPIFNLIVTNVPGPEAPLYALGARMLEAFPIVPLVGNQGLNVAALSYVDRLNLGVFSDPEVCPDAEIFCEGATRTLQELSGS